MAHIKMKPVKLCVMIVQVATLVLKLKIPQFRATLQNTVLFVLVFASHALLVTGRYLHHCMLYRVIINFHISMGKIFIR